MSSMSATETSTVSTLAESQPWARKALIVLFALSGFSGLIYENIWSYYLKLFLGHAAYAQTLVLAIFMGGMAIGAWFSAKYSSRWSNTLRVYAVTEGIIGVFGLVFHGTFEWAIDLAYSAILPSLGDPISIGAFKWGLSTLLILPQSILLGMTFPLMSTSLVRHSQGSSGSTIALLYFTNSIGAAIGVLLSGFWLVGQVGLPGTILTAALLNIVIALFAWLLGRPEDEGLPLPVGSISQPVVSTDSFYWLMLSVSLLTGVASFIYEISWIRMLSLVMGSSTHSFELMLSAFILGLAFGGLWIKKKIDGIKNMVLFLGIVQIIMGLLAMATVALYSQTFELMQALVRSLGKTEGGYVLYNIISYLISIGLMFPATFCAGMTLPLLTHALLQRKYGEKSVGHVYAANTIGAIVGVFGAIHLGMPLLGLKGLMTFGATLDMVVGFGLLWHMKEVSGRRPLIYGAAVVVASVGFTTVGVQWDILKMASGVYRTGTLLDSKNASILYHKDGKTATVDLVSHGGGLTSIRTNGKSDASIQTDLRKPRALDESTMIFAATFPLALHPDAKVVANIGFGSGLTSHVLLGSNKLERVDTIEIEEAIVQAAKGFRPRVEAVYADPRSHIHFDDAKTYFSSHGSKYDIIISEPSNPWVSGVSSLFTDEFYRMVKTHLNDKGLFVQWFQMYEIDPEIVFSVLKALDKNFSDYALYKSAIDDLIIVASDGGNVSAPTGAPLESDAIKKELARYGIYEAEDFMMWKVAEKRSLLPLIWSFDVPMNSDYFPYLDLHAPKTRFLDKNARELAGLLDSAIPVLEMLGEAPPRYSTKRRQGGQYFFRTELMFQASAVRHYLLGEKSVGAEKLGSGLQADLALIRLNMLECMKGQEIEGWFDAVLTVAARTNANQSPTDANRMWTHLEASSCPHTFTPLRKMWFSLFKAVGARDAGEMLNLSEHLLAQADTGSANQRFYLLMAAMTSALVLHDEKKAMALWEEHEQRIIRRFGTPGLVFRLLVAHSAINRPTDVGLATK
jgi:spermidine synthase